MADCSMASSRLRMLVKEGLLRGFGLQHSEGDKRSQVINVVSVITLLQNVLHLTPTYRLHGDFYVFLIVINPIKKVHLVCGA